MTAATTMAPNTAVPDVKDSTPAPLVFWTGEVWAEVGLLCEAEPVSLAVGVEVWIVNAPSLQYIISICLVIITCLLYGSS